MIYTTLTHYDIVFFQKVLRKEGVLAFWTGFGAYYTRCAPHAMIILLTLDEFKKLYAQAFMR